MGVEPHPEPQVQPSDGAPRSNTAQGLLPTPGALTACPDDTMPCALQGRPCHLLHPVPDSMF